MTMDNWKCREKGKHHMRNDMDFDLLMESEYDGTLHSTQYRHINMRRSKSCRCYLHQLKLHLNSSENSNKMIKTSDCDKCV